MKKILSFLLALALLIGIIPMSFASAATLTDAVKSNYSIETTLSDGIIQKTAKRTFFVIAKDGERQQGHSDRNFQRRCTLPHLGRCNADELHFELYC